MPYPRLSPLILPYTRLELPGAFELFKRVVGNGREDDRHWAGARPRVARDKWHGLRMKLDLTDWSDRVTYFFGRYYQAQVQLLLDRVLSPEDRFVDVGANVGMVTLHAAARVGAAGVGAVQGRVDAIEPNPVCCERIAEQVRLNALSHVYVHPVALSDAEGEVDLNIVPGHTGFSTIGPMTDADRRTYSQRVAVRTTRGDALLSSEGGPVSVIKIDAEGFECHALRGLAETIERDRPIVVTELNRHCLTRAGSSDALLFATMHRHGYRAYALGDVVRGRQHRMTLTATITSDDAPDCDLAWVHSDDPRLSWLKPFMVTANTTVATAA